VRNRGEGRHRIEGAKRTLDGGHVGADEMRLGHAVEPDDGDAQRDDQRNDLTQFSARRANRSGKKRQRHGVNQHHPVQGRGVPRREIAAPGRRKAEQERDDHWKDCTQNRV
jgi:hypothetical protein